MTRDIARSLVAREEIATKPTQRTQAVQEETASSAFLTTRLVLVLVVTSATPQHHRAMEDSVIRMIRTRRIARVVAARRKMPSILRAR